MTAAELIDYLGQFESDTPVVLDGRTEEAADKYDGYIDLSAAFEQFKE